MKMVLGNQQRCACEAIAIPQKEEHLEVKSGTLIMMQTFDNKSRKVPVFVRVYKSKFEHYAVIYRNQTFTNNSVYVSLKNSTVFRSDNKNEIRVIPDNVEGTQLTFLVMDGNETDDWMCVLQSSLTSQSPKSGSLSPSLSPVIPRTPIMPTLEELEEEGD